ncbi:MAG: hypothetical protein SGPRY_001038 [Prymnesium sp.]
MAKALEDFLESFQESVITIQAGQIRATGSRVTISLIAPNAAAEYYVGDLVSLVRGSGFYALTPGVDNNAFPIESFADDEIILTFTPRATTPQTPTPKTLRSREADRSDSSHRVFYASSGVHRVLAGGQCRELRRSCVETSSAAVRLERQIKLTAATKKELGVALSLCGGESLSVGQRGRLLRAHCIDPARRKKAASPSELEQRRARTDGEDTARRATTTPQIQLATTMTTSSEVGANLFEVQGSVCDEWTCRRARKATRAERDVRIAVARDYRRLKDVGAVYEWREQVVDAVARVGARGASQSGAPPEQAPPRSSSDVQMTRWAKPQTRLAAPATLREAVTTEGEPTRGRVPPSGAAPLAMEVQPGAVSADLAERLHEAARAGQLQFALGGDVGAGIRMVPEHLQADLARAVGSNGRVDAAGECIADRVSLPGPVRCMCSTLVSQVQRAVRDLPAEDEAGLRNNSSEVTRRLAAAAVTGRFGVRERLCMTAASMRMDARAVTEWLIRVMDTWEAQNVGCGEVRGVSAAQRKAQAP